MHIIHHEYPICMVVALLTISAGVSIVNRWLKIPYSIALVLIGLIIGQFSLLPELQMNPHLVLLVFLPPLLFDAAINLKLKKLASLWKPVFILATIGVFITVAITALLLHFILGLEPLLAILLACIVSPTDPVSVVAVFKKLGVNSNTISLIEGESLFNDGTAVVLFRLVQASILAGSNFMASIQSIPLEFFLLALGAVCVGGAIGYVSARVSAFFDDRSLIILLTTIVAYGTYIVAEALHVSEIIAVVVSALVFAKYTTTSILVSSSTIHALKAYWGYLSLVFNSFIFVMIGAHIRLADLANYAPAIAVTVLGLVIARALLVYGLLPISMTGLDSRVKHLAFLGALRGSLSMAMVMSLPMDFPNRKVLEIVTFGVVLFTLLVQGLSMEPLSRRLSKGAADLNSKIKILRNMLIVENAVAARLYGLFANSEISRATFQSVDCDLKTRQMQLHEELTDLSPFSENISKDELDKLLTQLHGYRDESLRALYDSHAISKEELDQAVLYLTES